MSAPDSSSRPSSKNAPRQNARSARKRWGDRGPAGTPPSLRPARLRSFLAARTPVGHARSLALRPRANSGPAPPAWAPGAPVDVATARPAGSLHEPRRSVEDAPQPLIVDVAKPDPRLHPRDEERLGLPHVPDSGDESLVEQRLATRPGLVGGAAPRDHPVQIRRRGHDVRAEPIRPSAAQLENRAMSLHRLPLRAAKNQPRLAEDRPSGRLDAPPPMHSQVAADDSSVLEGQQEVLADCLDANETSTVDALRDAEDGSPGVRRIRADDFAFQHPQALRGAIDRKSTRL